MSTPIETNTEELQEILQQVYDLPNRNSGGATWDMTIRFTRDNLDDYGPTNISVEDFVIDSTEIDNVKHKIRSGEFVNVRMLGGYRYFSASTYGVFTPIHIEMVNRLSMLFLFDVDGELYSLKLVCEAGGPNYGGSYLDEVTVTKVYASTT